MSSPLTKCLQSAAEEIFLREISTEFGGKNAIAQGTPRFPEKSTRSLRRNTTKPTRTFRYNDKQNGNEKGQANYETQSNRKMDPGAGGPVSRGNGTEGRCLRRIFRNGTIGGTSLGLRRDPPFFRFAFGGGALSLFVADLFGEHGGMLTAGTFLRAVAVPFGFRHDAGRSLGL